MNARAARIGIPVAFGVLFLLAWQAVVVGNDIKPYLLPKPTAIWTQIADNIDDIVKTARVTGTNALVGLVAGAVLGILAALVASRFRDVDSLLVPLAAAVNAMPIIALAPIFNTMFSTTSAVPRRLVVTWSCSSRCSSTRCAGCGRSSRSTASCWTATPPAAGPSPARSGSRGAAEPGPQRRGRPVPLARSTPCDVPPSGSRSEPCPPERR